MNYGGTEPNTIPESDTLKNITKNNFMGDRKMLFKLCGAAMAVTAILLSSFHPQADVNAAAAKEDQPQAACCAKLTELVATASRCCKMELAAAATSETKAVGLAACCQDAPWCCLIGAACCEERQACCAALPACCEALAACCFEDASCCDVAADCCLAQADCCEGPAACCFANENCCLTGAECTACLPVCCQELAACCLESAACCDLAASCRETASACCQQELN